MALGGREESQQGDPLHALHHLEKHTQRTPTDTSCGALLETIIAKLGDQTDELAKNEATARAAKWCIDSCQAVIRYRTDPKETPRARRDESGAVVPDAICTFEYEVEW